MADSPSNKGALYAETISSIPDSARTLLEKYANIPSDDVLPHIHRVRDKAWAIAPYGCIGLGGFVTPTIQTHPSYSTILTDLKAGKRMLDLGCGLGQNMRQLWFDGAPDASVAGADVSLGLIQCGYELFADEGRASKTVFLNGDVFDAGGPIHAMAREQFDYVFAGMFFHLWDWEGQIEASVQTSRLLKPSAGSRVVGWQIGGSGEAVEIESRRHEGGKRRMFAQNEGSLKKLWDEVGERTGSKWKVTAENDRPEWLLEAMKGVREVERIVFTIERL